MPVLLPLAVVVLGALLLLAPPWISIPSALAFAAWPFFRYLDLWRAGVVVSLASSVLRTGPFAEMLSPQIWYLAQFGPLVLASLMLLLQAPGLDGSRSARAAIALALLTPLSFLWSIAAERSLQNGAMFVLLVSFAALTRTRRWSQVGLFNGDLLLIFSSIVALQAVGLIAGVLGYDWALLWGARFRGLFINPNYTGILAALGVIIGGYLVASRGRATVPMIAAVLSLIPPLLLSGSRGPVLAVLLAVAALALRSGSGRLRAGLLAGGLVATIVVPLASPGLIQFALGIFTREGGFSSGRTALWAALLSRWTESPFLGIGYASTQTLDSQRGLAAHNIYLQFLVELGILGVVGLLVLIHSLFVERARSGPVTVLGAGALTIGLIEFTEASVTGAGNSVALTAWLVVLASTVPMPTIAPGEAAEEAGALLASART